MTLLDHRSGTSCFRRFAHLVNEIGAAPLTSIDTAQAAVVQLTLASLVPA